MNSNIHYFEKTNYAVLIEEDERPYSNLRDYSDFEDNSISHLGFKNVGIDPTVFTGETQLFSKMDTVMEEPYELLDGGFQEWVNLWEKTKVLLKGTHDFSEQPVDYDAAAVTVFENYWQELLNSHVEFLEQGTEQDFKELCTNVEKSLYLKELKFFEGFDCELFQKYLEDDLNEKQIEEFKKQYCEHVKNFKVKNVTDLDNVCDYFLRGDFDTWGFENCFMLPDPDILNKALNSYQDFCVNLNPYLEWGYLGESWKNFRIIDAEDFDNSNCIIIATKPKGYRNVLSSVNQYLEGEWFWGEVYYVVPENELWKYSDQAEYDARFEAFVINTNESCGGFETEEAVKEHFEYYETAEAPKFKLNYQRLGTVKTV